LEDGPPGFPQDFSCPVVLGKQARSRKAFAYRAITSCRRSFQIVRLTLRFFTSRSCRDRITPAPATPDIQRSRALTYAWFGPIPFRSPLLRESRLLSFPRGTEMVHFPPLACRFLFDSEADVTILLVTGCPIRKSPGQRLFAAHRGLSQLTTSFIALLRQGIHRVPLVA
jgi:hypothetical protein